MQAAKLTKNTEDNIKYLISRYFARLYQNNSGHRRNKLNSTVSVMKKHIIGKKGSLVKLGKLKRVAEAVDTEYKHKRDNEPSLFTEAFKEATRLKRKKILNQIFDICKELGVVVPLHSFMKNSTSPVGSNPA